MSEELIEKLQEKLARNPGSKFFLPLGEEYARVGRYDEAISLLHEGITNHPDYTSARVSLAKVLLKKEMYAEAMAQFEEVLEQNPDNLLCHRKLASIYVRTGRVDKARASCNKVLFLNPHDKEMLEISELIKSGNIQATPEVLINKEEKKEEDAPDIFAEILPDAELIDKVDLNNDETIKNIDEITDIFAGETEPDIVYVDEKEEDAGQEVDETSTPSYLEKTSEILDEFEPPLILSPENKPDEIILEEDDKDKLKKLSEASGIFASGKSSLGFSGFNEDYNSGLSGKSLNEGDAELLNADKTDELDDLSELITQLKSDKFKSEDEEDDPVSFETVSLADLYISQGNLDEGINIYRQLLQRDPDNEGLRIKLDNALGYGKKQENETCEINESEAPQEDAAGEMVILDKVRETEKTAICDILQPVLSDKDIKLQRLEMWLQSIKRQQMKSNSGVRDKKYGL